MSCCHSNKTFKQNPRPGHVRCKSSSLASTVPVALLHFKGLRSRATGLHVQGGKTRLQMQPTAGCVHLLSVNEIKYLVKGGFFNTAPALESLPQKHGTSKVVVALRSQGQRRYSTTEVAPRSSLETLHPRHIRLVSSSLKGGLPGQRPAATAARDGEEC